MRRFALALALFALGLSVLLAEQQRAGEPRRAPLLGKRWLERTGPGSSHDLRLASSPEGALLAVWIQGRPHGEALMLAWRPAGAKRFTERQVLLEARSFSAPVAGFVGERALIIFQPRDGRGRGPVEASWGRDGRFATAQPLTAARVAGSIALVADRHGADAAWLTLTEGFEPGRPEPALAYARLEPDQPSSASVIADRIDDFALTRWRGRALLAARTNERQPELLLLRAQTAATSPVIWRSLGREQAANPVERPGELALTSTRGRFTLAWQSALANGQTVIKTQSAGQRARIIARRLGPSSVPLEAGAAIGWLAHNTLWVRGRSGPGERLARTRVALSSGQFLISAGRRPRAWACGRSRCRRTPVAALDLVAGAGYAAAWDPASRALIVAH